MIFYGTYLSIFEFLSMSFTDIETRICVHDKCLFAPHCLHLSVYFMTCHTLNRSFTDSPSNLRLRKQYPRRSTKKSRLSSKTRIAIKYE